MLQNNTRTLLWTSLCVSGPSVVVLYFNLRIIVKQQTNVFYEIYLKLYYGYKKEKFSCHSEG